MYRRAKLGKENDATGGPPREALPTTIDEASAPAETTSAEGKGASFEELRARRRAKLGKENEDTGGPPSEALPTTTDEISAPAEAVSGHSEDDTLKDLCSTLFCF